MGRQWLEGEDAAERLQEVNKAEVLHLVAPPHLVRDEGLRPDEAEHGLSASELLVEEVCIVEHRQPLLDAHVEIRSKPARVRLEGEG